MSNFLLINKLTAQKEKLKVVADTMATWQADAALLNDEQRASFYSEVAGMYETVANLDALIEQLG
jgi:hypothetical protein